MPFGDVPRDGCKGSGERTAPPEHCSFGRDQGVRQGSSAAGGVMVASNVGGTATGRKSTAAPLGDLRRPYSILRRCLFRIAVRTARFWQPESEIQVGCLRIARM
jgi:hypothetical protein